MAHHRLEPSPETTVDVFDRSIPPVLTLEPGDRLTATTLDASGYLERQRHPGEAAPRMFASARGHCLAGPVEVRGARPGDVLAVRLSSLVPGPWGWTVAGGRDTPVFRRLGLHSPADVAWSLWDIDAASATATDQWGHTVHTAPFLGVIGVPPAQPGPHSTIPPRPAGGGNIDCRDLVAGSTLYLPVTVPGAMVCLGDGHAAQGHGEVAGTAIECAMTTELTVDLLGPGEAALDAVHADTPAGMITFGFDADLNEATGAALDAMVAWMAARFGLGRADALALASPTVDLHVTQVANQAWGVHAVLPHDAVTGAAED